MSICKETAAEIIHDFNSDNTVSRGRLESDKITIKENASTAGDMYRNSSPTLEDENGEALEPPQHKPYFFNSVSLYSQLEKYYEEHYKRYCGENASLFRDFFWRNDAKRDAADDGRKVFIKQFFISKEVHPELAAFLTQTLNQDGFYNRLAGPVGMVCVKRGLAPVASAGDEVNKYYIFYDAKKSLDIIQEYSMKEVAAFNLDEHGALLSPMMLVDDKGELVQEKKTIELKTLTHSQVRIAADGTVRNVSTEYFVSAKDPEMAKEVIQETGASVKEMKSHLDTNPSFFWPLKRKQESRENRENRKIELKALK